MSCTRLCEKEAPISAFPVSERKLRVLKGRVASQWFAFSAADMDEGMGHDWIGFHSMQELVLTIPAKV